VSAEGFTDLGERAEPEECDACKDTIYDENSGPVYLCRTHYREIVERARKPLRVASALDAVCSDHRNAWSRFAAAALARMHVSPTLAAEEADALTEHWKARFGS
jgi:hypothetical protein